MKTKSLVFIASLVALMLFVAGCHSKPADSAATNETAAAQDSHGDHDHAEEATAGQTASKTDMEKMMEELASFSEEDRASAMKQHMCPVSDQMLGSMGAPEKVDVNGQAVWICCDGCKDKLLADPDKYLEKLATAAATAKQAE